MVSFTQKPFREIPPSRPHAGTEGVYSQPGSVTSSVGFFKVASYILEARLSSGGVGVSSLVSVVVLFP